ELNVALGIFGLQEEHLSSSEIGDVIVNGRADENDVLFEQAGIDIVGALAPAGLFHDHRHEGCGTVLRIVVKSFHYSKCVLEREPFTSFPLRRRCESENFAQASREFCRFAASLSSYRAYLALSNERELLVRIRHYGWRHVRAHDSALLR